MEKLFYQLCVLFIALLSFAACSRSDTLSDGPGAGNGTDSTETEERPDSGEIVLPTDSVDIVLPTDSTWMGQIIGAKWKFYGFGAYDSEEIRKAKPNDCESCYIITFGEDGKITGTTSSNDFSGDYIISVDSLTILQPVCTTKVGEIGDGFEFYESLLSCTNYVINDKQLFLYYNNKKNYLLFNELSE